MGKLVFGVGFYWGKPANPGKMRFHTGTLCSKIVDGERSEQKHFAKHEIIGLYGCQIGKSFIGRIALGQWGVERSGWEKKDG